MAWRGVAWRGVAWRGEARRGEARGGEAREGRGGEGRGGQGVGRGTCSCSRRFSRLTFSCLTCSSFFDNLLVIISSSNST